VYDLEEVDEAGPVLRRYLGHIRAMFKAPDGGARLLVQTYVRVRGADRLLPHEAQAWHLMTRESQPLRVVDVQAALCDTAYAFPVLFPGIKLSLPREGTEEVIWLPRDLYFPVHEYPREYNDDGIQEG
jgi:hypothetical protein